MCLMFIKDELTYSIAFPLTPSSSPAIWEKTPAKPPVEGRRNGEGREKWRGEGGMERGGRNGEGREE